MVGTKSTGNSQIEVDHKYMKMLRGENETMRVKDRVAEVEDR